VRIIPKNNFILVEPNDKAKKKSEDDPFSSFVVSKNLGFIKYSSVDEFPVGAQIYYGPTYEPIIVNGQSLNAMATTNVVALVME